MVGKIIPLVESYLGSIKEGHLTKMGSKRSKKPIKRRKSQGVIKRRLDVRFSKHIRDIENNICGFCGAKGKRMECHHGVVHRRYMNTRYEPDNCACVCGGCHRFLSDFPKINTEFFRKRIGAGRMEQLEILARSGKKVDLEQVEIELKRKMEALE